MSHSCIFFGTPEFAIPALQGLLASAYKLSAVVTRPDKPAGRGKKVSESAVKRFALEADLKLLQPVRLREEAVAELKALAPDFLVVAAYGLLIPPRVLALPPHGALNVHPSLLPRHRGASPIQGAILAGDDHTGVSIMLMDEGLDTGPVLARGGLPILDNESAGELSGRLAAQSASLLMETVPRWLNGEIEPQPQDDAEASYSGQIQKRDAVIDWQLSAEQIWRRIRAFNPTPGAETSLNGSRLKIWKAWPLPGKDDASPGRVCGIEGIKTGEDLTPAIVVGCGKGTLAILELQKEGRRPLGASEFARGERQLTGVVLGSEAKPATKADRLSPPPSIEPS